MTAEVLDIIDGHITCSDIKAEQLADFVALLLVAHGDVGDEALKILQDEWYQKYVTYNGGRHLGRRAVPTLCNKKSKVFFAKFFLFSIQIM